jgi:U6 snRNA-associated Sm-like protein LSm7
LNSLILDPDDQYKITDNTRTLGLVVCRGTQVSLISPSDGMEEIANPFTEDAEEDIVVK